MHSSHMRTYICFENLVQTKQNKWIVHRPSIVHNNINRKRNKKNTKNCILNYSKCIVSPMAILFTIYNLLDCSILCKTLISFFLQQNMFSLFCFDKKKHVCRWIEIILFSIEKRYKMYESRVYKLEWILRLSLYCFDKVNRWLNSLKYYKLTQIN